MAYDVVITGGGPVGLMLASELGLRGVSVLVVERLVQPDTTIKAGSINRTTVEAFDRRGLLPALEEKQRQWGETVLAFVRRQHPGATLEDLARKMPAGHFAGLWHLSAERLPPDDPDLGAGEHARVMGVAQQHVEQVLGERARELGVELRRGCAVTGFAEGGDGVTVDLDTGETVHAGWLVGCDGGRSLVRRLAGFEFPGTDPEITGHQAMVQLADPEKLPTGWHRTPVGMLAHGPMPGRVLTVEYDGPPADRDAPVTRYELQASLRHVSGTDVTVTAVQSATRWTDNARQASTYRIGRVLLAGDAAHVHSPFGGQGLNLGIGDAVNLGWKLAATIEGSAQQGLLDTYTTERHPVGAWVLDWTRAQVALMRPDSKTGALREIVTDLMGTVDGNTYFIKKLAGVLHRYDLGGGHSLVGRSAPDLPLSDGTRLADHCHDGTAVLYDLADNARLRELVAAWGDRISVFSATSAEGCDLAGLLIRPDGCVAWAADRSADKDSLHAALTRWFGSPAEPRDLAVAGEAGHR